MNTHRNQPVLEASSLNRFLGTDANQVHVLRDLSLLLNPAQVYSITGPSGCGKSTLLYILGLLDFMQRMILKYPKLFLISS